VLAQTSTSIEDASLLAEMLSLPNDGRYPTTVFADAMQRLGYERADKVPGTGARVYLGVSLKKLDYAAHWNRND
jgi:hypothetical protein